MLLSIAYFVWRADPIIPYLTIIKGFSNWGHCPSTLWIKVLGNNKSKTKRQWKSNFWSSAWSSCNGKQRNVTGTLVYTRERISWNKRLSASRVCGNHVSIPGSELQLWNFPYKERWIQYFLQTLKKAWMKIACQWNSIKNGIIRIRCLKIQTLSNDWPGTWTTLTIAGAGKIFR